MQQDADLRTLEAMAAIFCRANHAQCARDERGLCAQCRETVAATLARTQACPFGHAGNCQDCSIKCQRGDAQQRIREIMRYAAPRMFIRHPVMAAKYVRKKLVHKAKA